MYGRKAGAKHFVWGCAGAGELASGCVGAGNAAPGCKTCNVKNSNHAQLADTRKGGEGAQKTQRQKNGAQRGKVCSTREQETRPRQHSDKVVGELHQGIAQDDHVYLARDGGE